MLTSFVSKLSFTAFVIGAKLVSKMKTQNKTHEQQKTAHERVRAEDWFFFTFNISVIISGSFNLDRSVFSSNSS